ncbi:type II secretion system protein [Cyanobacteria bacterium FACHB-DQ100]|uniref:type II secretion system protein n=1 Tax=Leptolyngbya sp. DQ-M1 TaxID=2933920 RepID=UPI001983C5BF|nr:type II secretion system protein [Cyanobacteria bacterium FACHB-DQ100]
MVSKFTKRQTPLPSRLGALRLIHNGTIAKQSDAGLTLIESLIAIVVIAITMVSITPPIFWAVASRVQVQRAEQALKLAQGEIDRVRVIIERGETANLPPSVANLTEADVRNSTSGRFPAAPNTAGTGVISTRACTNVGSIPSAIGTFAQLDTNGDCVGDYLLQTFRSQGFDQNGNRFEGTTGQVLTGFVMGVRVYSAIARDELTAQRGETQPASLRGTNGLGNQRNRPLAVLYSTIVRSSESQNLELYRKLCPAASQTTGAC